MCLQKCLYIQIGFWSDWCTNNAYNEQQILHHTQYPQMAKCTMRLKASVSYTVKYRFAVFGASLQGDCLNSDEDNEKHVGTILTLAGDVDCTLRWIAAYYMNMPWHGAICVSLAISKLNPLITGGFLSLRAHKVKVCFVFLVGILNGLLNKPSSNWLIKLRYKLIRIFRSRKFTCIHQSVIDF